MVLLGNVHLRVHHLAMALGIAKVARVREPAVQAAVVLDHLVHAAALMTRVQTGLRLHRGIDVGLRRWGAGLHRGPSFDREGRSGQAEQGGGRKYQGEFPHGVPPLDFYSEQFVRLMTINVVRVTSFRELQISQVHEPLFRVKLIEAPIRETAGQEANEPAPA
jgi:hypothetical protein